jgi:hypothetical protein
METPASRRGFFWDAVVETKAYSCGPSLVRQWYLHDK